MSDVSVAQGEVYRELFDLDKSAKNTDFKNDLSVQDFAHRIYGLYVTVNSLYDVLVMERAHDE